VSIAGKVVGREEPTEEGAAHKPHGGRGEKKKKKKNTTNTTRKKKKKKKNLTPTGCKRVMRQNNRKRTILEKEDAFKGTIRLINWF